MSQIKITINTDNSAFDDDLMGQVASILEGLAHNFRNESQESNFILDVNGNKCGWVGFRDMDHTTPKFEPAQEHYE
jgi:hypothetical protein